LGWEVVGEDNEKDSTGPKGENPKYNISGFRTCFCFGSKKKRNVKKANMVGVLPIQK
jgi:hypothetical protein